MGKLLWTFLFCTSTKAPLNWTKNCGGTVVVVLETEEDGRVPLRCLLVCPSSHNFFGDGGKHVVDTNGLCTSPSYILLNISVCDRDPTMENNFKDGQGVLAERKRSAHR
jgi:hypothetical protein